MTEQKAKYLGYSISNCVACCKVCNYAKHIMNYQEFINWIDLVYTNLV